MPQSLSQLNAHLIFSTKNRQPFLNEEIRPRVHAYLATIIRNLDSPWVVVGGVADHVHILFVLSFRLQTHADSAAEPPRFAQPSTTCWPAKFSVQSPRFFVLRQESAR